MHGGSGSDDEGPKVEEEEEKPNGGQGCLREERPRERVDQGDLASVREPTGRWNPRSRLIAIKAPLRLRL